MEHLELNEKQKQFITDRFADGESLFDYVQQFDETASKISCKITHPQGSWIMLNDKYRCDVLWIASCATGIEIEFSTLRHQESFLSSK